MSSPIEIETSEAEITVVGTTAKPPTLTCVHSGRDTRGIRRDFVQQVPVQDADLAHRVLLELHQGDRAQITVVNKWYEDRCDTYLFDFKRVPDVETVVSIPKNGAASSVSNIVRDDITQITLLPEQNSKAKVKQ